MNHPRTLLVVALLVTAGCLGGPLADDGTPSPAQSPTASPPASPPDTPVRTPYPNTTAEFPDGPKERPDRPAAVNGSTAREYVRVFEYRYAYNSLWYSEHSDVEVDCEVGDVTGVAGGYNVTVRCSGYSNTRGEAEGNRTATELHADWGTQDVRYYVDGNSTIRFGWVDTS